MRLSPAKGFTGGDVLNGNPPKIGTETIWTSWSECVCQTVRTKLRFSKITLALMGNAVLLSHLPHLLGNTPGNLMEANYTGACVSTIELLLQLAPS